MSLSCVLLGGAGREQASLPCDAQLSRKTGRWSAPPSLLFPQAAMFIRCVANNKVPGTALMPVLLSGISRESRSVCSALLQNPWEPGASDPVQGPCGLRPVLAWVCQGLLWLPGCSFVIAFWFFNGGGLHSHYIVPFPHSLISVREQERGRSSY